MKRRPVFRHSLLALHAAALTLLGTAPDALAQTSLWHTRAASGWEARADDGRFLPDATPWWWDLPAFRATASQPQAAGQDLHVDNNTTYTVSGNEQWANVYVIYDNSNNGYVVQNAGTTMTISGLLSLGNVTATATGSYTLNGGALSAATERIGYFTNGTFTFTQGGGTNAVGSGGLSLSHANAFGSAYNTGVYNLNGGTLSTPFVANGGGATSNFNFNGGTLQATGNNTSFMGGLSSANVQSGGAFINPNGYAVTISQSLSGSGGLTQSGGGTLTLSGASTYTGGTTINAGTLIPARSATGNGGVGTFAGGSNVTINSGGTLLLAGTDSLGYGSGNASLNINGGLVTTDGTGHTTINSVTFTGGTLTANGPGDSYGSYYFLGPVVTKASSSAATFNASNGGSVSLIGVNGNVSFNVAKGTTSNGVDLLVSAPLTSGGALVKTGPGTLSLTAANTYTGGTTVNMGMLIAGHSADGSGTGTFAGGSTVTVYASTLLLAGGDSLGFYPGKAVGNLVIDGGQVTTDGSAHHTTIDQVTMTMGSLVSNGPGDGSFGALYLNGPINTVASGTSTLSATNGGYVSLIGGDGAGGNVTFNVARGMIGDSPDLQISAPLAGGAGFIKTGTGVLQLTGANTYTGATTISGGMLTVDVGGSLGTGNYAGSIANAGSLIFGNPIFVTPTFQTLSGVVSGAGSLTVGATGRLTLTGTNTYTGATTTISGGTLTVGGAGTLGAGNYAGNIADAGSFLYNSSAAQTLGGVISGAGTLTQAGPGTLTLTGNNTYTGATTFAGGILSLGSAGALGTSGTLSFTGGTLQYGSANTADYSARFSTAAGQAYSVDTNGQNVTFATGLTSSGGTLTKLGAGTLTLTGNNTYTGGTAFAGGALNMGSTGALGSTGTLSFTGGTLQFSAANQTDYSARFSGAAGQIYNLDTNGQNVTFASGLTSSGGSLTKLGAGTLTLTGTNTYTGSTTVNAGTLQIGNGGTTGTLSANSLITDNAALVFNHSDALTQSAAINGTGSLTQAGAGALTLTGANTYTGATTISGGTLTLGSAGTLGAGSYAGNIADAGSFLYNSSAAQTLSGVISGAGSLTQAGSGTLTLTGTNTYTGNTTVNAGTLAVGGSGALTNTSVTVNPGGTLAISDSASVNTGNSRTLTVNGALNLSGGTLSAGGNTTIGNTGNGAFTQSGGTFTTGVLLNIGSTGVYNLGAGTLNSQFVNLGGAFNQSGGTHTAVNDFLIGTSDAGTYTLSGGSLSVSGNALVGAFTDGTFNQSDGTHTASGGFVVGNNGSNGTCNLSGGTLSVTGTEAVGSGGPGTFTQTGGMHTAGALTVGLNPSGIGVYNFGGGTLNISGAETIGSGGGAGTFNQTGGAYTASTVTLGGDAGSNGTYHLGGGTLTAGNVVGGAGTSAFGFDGGTLQVSADQGALFQGVNTVGVRNGGATVDTSGHNVTLATPLLHSTFNGDNAIDGGLTKNGGGSLTLTGANTYTGATNVNADTLLVPNGVSITATSALNVAASQFLTLSGNGSVHTSGAVTLGSASLTQLSDNASLTGAGALTVNNGGQLSIYDQSTVNVAGPVTFNSYAFLSLTFGGSLTGGSLTLGPVSTLTTIGGTINLGNGALTLDGYAAYNNATLTDGSATVGNGGTGTFNQNSGTHTVAGTLTLGALAGSNGTYNLGGGTLADGSAIVGNSGGGTFNQSSTHTVAGTLTLGAFAGSNGTYNLNGGTLTANRITGGAGTGTFYFNGGTLAANGNQAQFFQGVTAAYVRNGGAVIDTASYSVTAAQGLLHSNVGGDNAIDGGLTKLGAGRLTLTRANTYTGGTTISAGTLLAQNTTGSATGTGAVTVQSGGTLGGNGTLAGPVTISDGGTLAPGAQSVSRLTLQNTLTLQTGSTLAITLGGTTAGSTYDQIAVNGTLTLAGTLQVGTVNGFTLAAGQTFTILDNTSDTAATAGMFTNAIGTLYTDAAGQSYLINYAANADGGALPNDVTLTYLGQNVVPEPSAWTFLALGTLGLGLVLHHRRRA